MLKIILYNCIDKPSEKTKSVNPYVDAIMR